MLDDPTSWKDRVFVMVSPDCIVRRLVRDVLRRFAEIGLEPVGWRLATVTPDRIDRMSELQQLTADKVYRYRALDALFRLGPALMIVLADQLGRSADDFYAQAKDLKGDAEPSHARPGTIRHDLGATNKVLNLVHTSDSPQAAAAECPVLSGGTDPTLYCSSDVEPVLQLLEFGPREYRDHAAVLGGVRTRLTAAVWAQLSPAARTLADRLVRDATIGDPLSGKLLEDALSAEQVHPPEAATVLGMAFDGCAPAADLHTVRRVLAWHGLRLDPWEDAVLTTGAVFAPVAARPL
ncbi:nucleoside-diphosphate kinase [Streptomyces uncialis]|uniref:nucleoside-diphosphate kinase n=1 Tax=Streptomyces uncialis TaxID=1048205 RepID=UPI002E34111B|nr:nucleoside-diphosphate kinase [Streptomyces uncialis]